MRKSRILIVDDDPGVLKSVRANLQARDSETLIAMDGTEALKVIENELPDLIILDIMTPKMDGFEVCRQIREWSQIPIIMFSARRDVEETAKCLNSGADGYITNPFAVNELIARVRALLRRTKEVGTIPAMPNFTSGDLQISFAQNQVTVAGKEVELTPTEYILLQEFVLNTGKVLTHTYLLNKVWGSEYRDERWHLHVFVRRLRAKLEPDPTNPKYIMTVPGVGYQFRGCSNFVA